MISKKEVRAQIRQKKKESDKDWRDQAAEACCRQLFETEEWKQADSILTYVSYNREMSTFPVIERALAEGKTVSAPRVEGEVMNFYVFTSIDELEKSPMNILEPVENQIPVPEDALMIMPGVAFDEQKNRVGYGGGFYDRYLTAHPHHKKIAIAYEFQILSGFETEEFDIRPDFIITEKRIIK